MKVKKGGVLAFALIVLVFSMHFVLIYTNPFKGNFNKGWELVDEDSAKAKSIDLPTNFGHLENLTIQKRLPANLASDYLYFFTADQTVCVFVDDELIYEYGTKHSNKAFMKGPVQTWHEVRMKRDYEGKTLKVFFTYPYAWHSGQVFKMYLSSPRDFFRNLVRKYWFGLVFSYFSLTIFLLIVTFASVFKKRFGDLGSIMFIATYALIASVWYLVDNKVFVFIIPSPHFLAALSIISMMLIDAPALLYAATIKDLNCNKFVKFFVVFKFLIIIILLVLELFNAIDIYSYRNYVHIFLYFSTFLFFVSLGIGILKAKRKDLIPPFFMYLLVVLVSSIDMVLYIYNQEAYSASYSAFASAIFISVLFIFATESLHNMMDENVKAGMYKNMASQDFMTNTKNKSAFLRDIDKLILSDKVGVLVFDINDLKTINEKYGHEKGDEAVIFVATLIKEMFSELGDCYRSGTDEFSVVINDAQNLDLYNLLKNFIATMDIKVKDLSYSLSVAIGCSVFNEKLDNRFKDTVKRAKERMNKNKNSQKLAE